MDGHGREPERYCSTRRGTVRPALCRRRSPAATGPVLGTRSIDLGMHLILVRHTRPAVPDGICYGSTDVDPATTFEEEAARVVAALPAAERLVTSPRRRCRRLAERIGAARNLDPVIDERLREMDFGVWEGVPWTSIARAELDAWTEDFFHARPHGGESVHMMRERVGAAIDGYRQGGVSCILVTHAGVIRAARALCGEPDGWTTIVEFGDWITLAFQ